MSDVPTNAPRSTSGDGLPTGGVPTVRVNTESIEDAARAVDREWQNWKDFPHATSRQRFEDAMAHLARLLNTNVR